MYKFVMNLFDRLPNGLFGPLIGRYNRRAWELLVRLSERFFGADCVPPYAEGYLHEQVTKEIERFLLDEQWEEESADAAATPINVQANQWLARLVETGWLIEDRVGLRVFVSMRPVVARFFDALEQFALDGPQLVAAVNESRSAANAERDASLYLGQVEGAFVKVQAVLTQVTQLSYAAAVAQHTSAVRELDATADPAAMPVSERLSALREKVKEAREQSVEAGNVLGNHKIDC